MIERKVTRIVEKLNSAENRQLMMNLRQERLQNLVNQYDVVLVAIAGGYKVGTLEQYLRVKNPYNIGEESVAQAEKVLTELLQQ